MDDRRRTTDDRRPTTDNHQPSTIVRYLVPLVLALVVFWTGYSSAAHRRYEALNGVPGEIVAGGSIGQTFVARYNGLSGIDVRIGTYGRQADAHRATLVMHLRSGPSSSVDIATANLPPSVVLDENGWYSFSFPAIDGSRGKEYYVQVESPDGTLANGLGLYWFKPNPLGNPYEQGTAYLDGKPTKADLTFGLGYSASPFEVWRGVLGSAAANSSALAIGALLVVAAGSIVWAVIWLPGILRNPEQRRHWLLRWSLPFALGVALVNSLLYMLLVPPWQGPDEYSHFAYAALLDKHNLDSKQVDSLNLYGKDRDDALIQAINASADRHDFTRLFLGSAAPGAPTDVTANVFQQTRQPATYYWLCAVAMRVARALGAPADPYTNPEAALMAMRSVSLLLELVVVALAWLAGVFLSGAKVWLPLFLPLTVALLPMHVFIAAVVNNDILAEVAVSALFVSLVGLLRWPASAPSANPSFVRAAAHPGQALRALPGDRLRVLGLAALSVLLALVSVLTKSTATAAALPLLAAGLVIWGVMCIANYAARRPLRITHYALRIISRPIVVVAAIALIVLVLAGAVLLAYERDEQSATGWFITSYDPIVRAARVKSDTAHQGSYVIELSTKGAGQASQNLVPPVYHPALDATFSGWVRLAPDQNLAQNSLRARISIMEGAREAGFGEAQLDPGSTENGAGWTHLTATGKISAGAEGVDLRLEAMGKPARVQFDDLSLQWNVVGGTWNDPIYRPALLNPSGEEPPTVLKDSVNRLLPGEARALADVLANPQEVDRGALWGDYAKFQYQTFWGSFGWLSIDLPGVFYVLIGVILLVALAGLVLRKLRTRVALSHGWPGRASLGVAVLLALAAAILIGFAKQESLLTYAGRPAYPQGRYLFVLIVPVVWLLLVGLGQFVGGRPTTDDRPPSSRFTFYVSRFTPSLAIWLYANALIFFAAYCLFALITPFYYS